MFTVLAPEMQWVYVAIKQLIAHSLQTPIKCPVTGPAKRARVICSTNTNQEAVSGKSITFFAANTESDSFLLLLNELSLCLLEKPSWKKNATTKKLHLTPIFLWI